MKRDISGAVMRLEIASGLLFATADSVPDGTPFNHGKRLFDEALALLKPAPGTASATTRKARKSKGEVPGGEDEIEKARRQVG